MTLETLKNFEDIYNEYGKISDSILKFCDFPIEIKELIKTNYIIFNKIINFYYNDTLIKINNGLTLNEILENITFINNPSTTIKKLYGF
jgi:hypothetical protein